MHARTPQVRSLSADNAPSAPARVPTDDSTVDTFALLLERRREAMAIAAEHGGERGDRAIQNWSASDNALVKLVTLIAGPQPSSVRLPDGTLVVISIDEFDDDHPDAEPRLFIIPPRSAVGL
jgi:hypothetical protein